MAIPTIWNVCSASSPTNRNHWLHKSSTCYMDFRFTAGREQTQCQPMLYVCYCLFTVGCGRWVYCCWAEACFLLTKPSVHTLRSYGWKGIANNRIDNHRLGEIVARIINMGIVPLKRFTTQVYESIYKRSAFSQSTTGRVTHCIDRRIARQSGHRTKNSSNSTRKCFA